MTVPQSFAVFCKPLSLFLGSALFVESDQSRQ
jgi:hypothetical protein